MAKKKRKQQPFSFEPKAGRNQPCPCKSGRKFKKCCGGPIDYTQKPLQYMSMHEALALQEAIDVDDVFIRRWGYTPGLAERSVMADGTEDDMVDLVVRKLSGFNADPKWIEAAKTLKMLVTSMNVQLITREQADAWNAFMGDTPNVLIKHCEEGCTCHQNAQNTQPSERSSLPENAPENAQENLQNGQ